MKWQPDKIENQRVTRLFACVSTDRRPRVSAAATVKKNDSACFPLFKRIDRRTNERADREGGTVVVYITRSRSDITSLNLISGFQFPPSTESLRLTIIIRKNKKIKWNKAERISHISNSTTTFMTVNQKWLTYSSTGWARNSLAKTSRIFSPTQRPLVNVVKVK